MINIASVDYSKLKKEYLRCDISQRELAEKYGVPYGTLRKVAAKEQWTELRNKTRTKADAKIIDAISDKEADRANKIIGAADLVLDKTVELITSLPATDIDTLKSAASILKILKEVKDVKSEADQQEQMARIAKLRKEAEDDAQTETTVTVKFEEDISKWSQ